ncbi:PD-(D/E)XK nuclease family protein [Nodosilinea sp. LEGE 07088]|uniref:PD-(D/E)XK nuclease family protein n=1 Tax=Nodosilinea sp. LEGE 07088 TaxID=2777968 RepID=UPI00187EF659|nr:PD-(D/E)XK nuclease family protein [Nodosilinea sp. LEGE 07088]MBE9136794.1 PD-(D/E)XK nuclease family protein [Nodosilinea sp. LEGE 07088]
MPLQPDGKTLPMLTLTQGHLRQLEICPRRYQYTYIDHYNAPIDPAMAERQRWGTQFHLVMQQRDLELPVDDLLQADPDLEMAVSSLQAAAPDLFIPQPKGFRQSEHRRTLAFNGYGLTAIYDLLVMDATSGHIVDWKTYQTPSSKTQLAQEWQTRLYLYLLVETSDLPPEQVAMTYWFVAPPGAQADPQPPSSVTIAYTAAQHRRTQADLQRLTDRLTALLALNDDLPQVDSALGHCTHCPYVVRCQRASERYAMAGGVELPAIADIAEVPL